MFIRSCKFIKRGAYDIAYDDNAMSSLIIQSIGSGPKAVTGVLKYLAIFTGKYL